MRSVTWILLGIATSLVLVTFFALAMHARPAIDDYWIAVRVRDEGFFGAQALWYTQWHGKFAGMAAMSAFPWLFDVVGQYAFAPLLLLIGILGASVVLVRSFHSRAPRSQIAGCAAVIAAMWISRVPEPQESIYWLTGAYAYQLGIVSAVVLVALLNPGQGTKGACFAVGVVGLALAGSSETAMLPAALISALVISARLFRRVELPRPATIAAIAILVGGAIMVAAPGNAIRGAQFTQHVHDLGRSLAKCFERGSRHVLMWLLDPALLGVSLMFATISRSIAGRLRIGLASRCVLVWLAVCVAFFPAYWATGHGPPPRAMAAVWSVFVLGWFFVVMPSLADRLLRRWPRIVGVGPALAAIGLLATGSTPAALRDWLSGDSAAFHNECLAREAAMAAARDAGAKELVLAPLMTRPRLLFVDDFGASSDDWRNGGPAAWFGIRDLRTAAR